VTPRSTWRSSSRSTTLRTQPGSSSTPCAAPGSALTGPRRPAHRPVLLLHEVPTGAVPRRRGLPDGRGIRWKRLTRATAGRQSVRLRSSVSRQPVVHASAVPVRAAEASDSYLGSSRTHSESRCPSTSSSADSEPFRTPVPIESVHRFRRFRTPAEEKLVAAGAR